MIKQLDKYTYLIDDEKYDKRNVDDLLYIESRLGLENLVDTIDDDTVEAEEYEETEEEEDKILVDEYGKVVWDVCMNTEPKYLGNKDVNYKWYALLNVNSNMKNENTPTKEGGTYGYAEAEEHRYIYENYIRSSMKLLEEMSDSKQRTVLNNIKKLAKVSGELVTIDETDEGETVYKIFNKTSYNKETHKFNKYVLIPSDILKFLVRGSNSNVIKIYCILLHKCNCEEWTIITNSYFTKGIGANANDRTDKTIKSCIDTLCMFQLVDKEKIVDTTQKDVNGKIITKTYCQYKLKPYSEWRAYYEERCNVRRRKK